MCGSAKLLVDGMRSGSFKKSHIMFSALRIFLQSRFAYSNPG
jgi:hypothetical protein